MSNLLYNEVSFHADVYKCNKVANLFLKVYLLRIYKAMQWK